MFSLRLMYRHFQDLQLANSLYKGEKPAFKELYNRYADNLLRLAMAKLPSPQDAEDCVQEIFCNFWQHCLAMTSPFQDINLEAYLVTCVKNYTFSYYKKKLQGQLLKQQVEMNAAYSESNTEEYLSQQEITRLLQDELGGMPEQMRKVFELSRHEDLSIREIASELDLSEQTVKNHMGRALRRLRLRLGPQLINMFL